MKYHLITIAAIVTLIACNPQSSETETPTTAMDEIEPTEPEETEVWEPVPAPITFDANNTPSDAIVLFDGSNLDAWENSEKGSPVGWEINEDGSMTVVPGSGDIQTKEKFGDIQLHIEWSSPDEIMGEGQMRGNSGIFLQNRYEVQVLDIEDMKKLKDKIKQKVDARKPKSREQLELEKRAENM